MNPSESLAFIQLLGEVFVSGVPQTKVMAQFWCESLKTMDPDLAHAALKRFCREDRSGRCLSIKQLEDVYDQLDTEQRRGKPKEFTHGEFSATSYRDILAQAAEAQQHTGARAAIAALFASMPLTTDPQKRDAWLRAYAAQLDQGKALVLALANAYLAEARGEDIEAPNGHTGVKGFVTWMESAWQADLDAARKQATVN